MESTLWTEVVPDISPNRPNQLVFGFLCDPPHTLNEHAATAFACMYMHMHVLRCMLMHAFVDGA